MNVATSQFGYKDVNTLTFTIPHVLEELFSKKSIEAISIL